MSAPPGNAGTAGPGVEQINTESAPELSTRKQQMRFLVANLGVTRPQAAALIRAYERDVERPAITARKSYAPSFIDWLMRQAPVKRKPTARKWQIGEGQWRTA